MNRSGLLIGVASVLAGTSVLLAILGAVYNLLLVGLAIPFAVAAYLLWMDATGRLRHRVRRRQRSARAGTGAGAGARRTTTNGTASRASANGGAGEPLSRTRARRVLGVGPDADQTEIRSAYRDRVKEVHPDADGGNEEAFKRLAAAYDRLRD